MERLTLRDAADRTGLSVTTLRRYIRSGRLAADKTPGRFGPEFTLTPTALEQAGIGMPGPRPALESGAPAGGNMLAGPASGSQLPAVPRGAWVPETMLREVIPVDLFRELSMKHEQLLVQYGMVRVGGQKLMEYKAEAEKLEEQLRDAREAAKAERDRFAQEIGFLKRHLRQAELEIEERNQQIQELREKTRVLELVSRNAITTESIEHQFQQVLDRRLAIEEVEAASGDERRRRLAELDEIVKSGFRPRPDENPTDQ